MPIDYAVGTLVVTNNGSLTFGPGVAVAALGNHGLRIENHGTIRAEGLPAAHGVARTPPRQSSTSNRSIVTRQPKPTSIPTPGTLTSSTPVRSSFTTPTPVPAPKPAPALHRGPAPALRSSIAPPLCCRIVHGIMPPAQQTCTCSSKTSSRMPPSKPQSARPTQDGSNIIKHSSGPAQPRKSIRSKHGHGRTSTPMKCSEKPSSLKCCLLTANG